VTGQLARNREELRDRASSAQCSRSMNPPALRPFSTAAT
jgi:hypothetical protein